MLFSLVVGYFAYAQYDVLFLYVILNDSEESHRKSVAVYVLHFGRGIFRYAQYDAKNNRYFATLDKRKYIGQKPHL